MIVTEVKATKDKSPWEQCHITLLPHVALYWIWSMLDSSERLLVNAVSPPIFGSQHCCRFHNRMQLNIRDLRLNTLYNKLSFLFQIQIARLWIPNDVNPNGLIRFTDLSRVGMLISKKFEKWFKMREWKHTRRWNGNWYTLHF